MVCRHAGDPLILEERPRPSPASDEILIRTRACGICHGDLMAQAGAFPFVNFPIVLGHEITGTVEAVGAEVSSWRKGDRVGLSVLFLTCGKCKHCRAGNENLCAEWVWTGMMKDGGYQEYLCAKAGYVVAIPEILDLAEAAPLLCAGCDSLQWPGARRICGGEESRSDRNGRAWESGSSPDASNGWPDRSPID